MYSTKSEGNITMPERVFKHTCECEKCGNEAEMEITCTIDAQQTESPKVVSEGQGTTKGYAVCSHCGGEADIWLDI